jgi:hypothetical protein
LVLFIPHGLLALQRRREPLDLLGQTLDVAVPQSEVDLRVVGLLAVEVDDVGDLIDGAGQPVAFDHAGRISLGAVRVDAEELSEVFERDVEVDARDGEEVVLEDGFVEDSAA